MRLIGMPLIDHRLKHAIHMRFNLSVKITSLPISDKGFIHYEIYTLDVLSNMLFD